ncbi:7-cyano-7-deazaguanine synthase QueC [Candidatus Nitrospira nitrificans]|jgi:7-cyano-7-deazaguanine synthase|uniref:7-cyano-7-deazaguanine synthase n=1 Tax=Candidatus Nitrospira nitrificans TaxID=1742973 RepID=A0A0S4LC36_9BACT|nr:7-cyano-7-deazaguanine synthase QueC [Candidatus Nitrospira nitrificans]CUS33428.1 7-cyano-7-deazaguanine synthase [Candidatus Nitrospira nitrificans]
MNGQISERAVVLASGGLDSTVTAALARREGYALYLLTIAYQQRHAVEIERSRQVATALEAHQHVVIDVDLRAIGGSALTGNQSVPKRRTVSERNRDVPVTYVPGRNLIFLSLAAAHAEVLGASIIYFGANVIDYSGYPDCRPEFIKTVEAAIQAGTKAGMQGKGIEIRTPLLRMSKAEIIRLGLTLNVPFHLTHSCYDPIGLMACGQCDSCLIRKRGFAEAGVVDPIQYAVC